MYYGTSVLRPYCAKMSSVLARPPVFIEEQVTSVIARVAFAIVASQSSLTAVAGVLIYESHDRTYSAEVKSNVWIGWYFLSTDIAMTGLRTCRPLSGVNQYISPILSNSACL